MTFRADRYPSGRNTQEEESRRVGDSVRSRDVAEQSAASATAAQQALGRVPLQPDDGKGAMAELDELLARAVERSDVPFIVAMVRSREGTLWHGASGRANGSRLASVDIVFRLFSMTKGIGALAALMTVERGLLNLNTPVSTVLPEFDDIEVLDSMGPTGPVLRPPGREVTLRHLLTHTSGLAYGTYNTKMAAWAAASDTPHAVTGLYRALHVPLMFDPGDQFAYGIGYDWVGQMIERVDGRRIDRFCQEEIFDPLGMPDTCFEPDGVCDRLADLTERSSDGRFLGCKLEPARHPEFYGLGGSLYGTPQDYMKFLRLLLNRGELDGQRLIHPATVDLMLTNQIGALRLPVMTSTVTRSADVDLVPGCLKSHSMAFLRNETAVPGMRAAGSLAWAGTANTHFWLDPRNDVAGVFMTQMLPFCDSRFMQTYAAFERAVYRHYPVPARG
jgi:methyl acetate hydrolase